MAPALFSYEGNMARKINFIVVHCTGATQGQTIASIQAYWKAPKPNGCGWKSPGYHKIIKPDGEVITLATEEKVTNGVGGYNSQCLHVCYIGGVAENASKKNLDNRTPQQKAALEKVIRDWKKAYPKAIVQGHRDFPGVTKACPSFDAKKEYACI